MKRISLGALCLLTACGGGETESPPAETLEGDRVEVQTESTEAAEGGAAAAGEGAGPVSHPKAVELLSAVEQPMAQVEGQECIEDGSSVTVGAMIRESAASAETQQTRCEPAQGRLACVSEFRNNSGAEMEEFYLHLEFSLSEDGERLVSVDGCLFAG